MIEVFYYLITVTFFSMVHKLDKIIFGHDHRLGIVNVMYRNFYFGIIYIINIYCLLVEHGNTAIRFISLHSLRHTFATALYEHGISDGVIIKLTGHSDTRVLENYYIDRQRDTTIQCKATDVLDGAFSPSKAIEGDFGHKKGELHNDSCETLLA